ncbi:MAG: fatty acid--CoA ligase family protein, partial [Nocardiaceae bacterium]|nr:fatty acid--CoA ligase family protein [Nocardiaceae bacterium]
VFLHQIAEEKVTYTAGRPAVLAAIERRDAPAVDLSTLTRIGVGSAPLAPGIVQTWRDRYGVELVGYFGTIEGVSLLAEPRAESGQRSLLYPRTGSANGTQLVLVHPETGVEIVDRGVVGELRVKGPTVFAGYLNPARDRDPFDADGYLRTGELFAIDGHEDGYLRYVDRSADLIVRDGAQIGSVELEGLIAEHPSVVEAAVVGCPDGRSDECIVAVVSCRPGSMLSLEELEEFLTGRGVAPVEMPQRLVISGVLPRNHTGNVLKRLLRDDLGRG